MTKEETETVKKFVAEYILENSSASSREIAEAVYNDTGIYVSHVTVQSILHALGYVAERWILEAGE